MYEYIVSFLVMLNPFAMFLYLSPVREVLKDNEFYKVLFKASLISFGIFILFLLLGNILFQKVFRISFESFRIFGGIVIFSLAYLFIVKGQRAFIQMKEDIDDLAEEISLPFMVGAGTISLTILMGNELTVSHAIGALGMILGINFFVIVFLKMFRDNIPKKKFKIAFDKNLGILLRLNGFFLGAIGINMILTGLRNINILS